MSYWRGFGAYLQETRRLHWLALTVVLWVAHGWDAFQLPKAHVDTYSEGFVTRKIEARALNADTVAGGFLHLPPELRAAAGGAAYRPNPGWQGIAVAELYDVTGNSPYEFSRASNLVFALLTSMAVAALVVILWRVFGGMAASFAFLAYLLSPSFASMASNLYWAIFIPVGIAAISWTLLVRKDDDDPNGGRLVRPGDLMILGGLMCLKALTGYEWITTIALFCCVPLVYRAYRDRLGWRPLLRATFAVLAATIAGFCVALAIHLVQGITAFGSVEVAFKPVLSRAIAHTYGDPELAKEIYQLDPKRYPTLSFIQIGYNYVLQGVIGLPGVERRATLLEFLAIFAGAAAGWWRAGRRLPWMPARMASHSWAVLAAVGAVLLAIASYLVLPDRSRVPDPIALKAVYRSTSPLLIFAVTILLSSLATVRARGRRAAPGSDLPAYRDASPLVLISAAAAFVAATSWVVLAKSHSSVHTALNIILYSMLFVPLVAAWLGVAVQQLVGWPGPPRMHAWYEDEPSTPSPPAGPPSPPPGQL